jgi:hypothetical protein
LALADTFAIIVAAVVAVIVESNCQIDVLAGAVGCQFDQHPDVEELPRTARASERLRAPGCSRSSETLRGVTPTPRPARTVPG